MKNEFHYQKSWPGKRGLILGEAGSRANQQAGDLPYGSGRPIAENRDNIEAAPPMPAGRGGGGPPLFGKEMTLMSVGGEESKGGQPAGHDVIETRSRLKSHIPTGIYHGRQPRVSKMSGRASK